MTITREQLEARLTELKPTVDTLKQQLFATLGAIADVEYWIAEDSKPAVESDKE